VIGDCRRRRHPQRPAAVAAGRFVRPARPVDSLGGRRSQTCGSRTAIVAGPLTSPAGNVHKVTDGLAGLPPVFRGVSVVVGSRYRTPSRPVRLGRPPGHRRLSAPAEPPIVSDGFTADVMRFRPRQFHFQFGLATLMGLPPNPTVRTRWGTRTFIRPPEPHQCPRTVSAIGQEPADADGTLGIAAPLPSRQQMSKRPPHTRTRTRSRPATFHDITVPRRTP
jgi:hypothetical protein